MSQTLEHAGRTLSLAIQAPPSKLPTPESVPGSDGEPKVVITGDVRLQITKQDAAGGQVKGCYRIITEGLQSPLHIIWMIEGNVLDQSTHEIEVAFDLRGTSAGEILTRLVSAQVTEKGGQGCIVHSSIFVQIVLVKKAKLGATFSPSEVSRTFVKISSFPWHTYPFDGVALQGSVHHGNMRFLHTLDTSAQALNGFYNRVQCAIEATTFGKCSTKKARASTMAKRKRTKKKKYLSPKEIQAKILRLPAR